MLFKSLKPLLSSKRSNAWNAHVITSYYSKLCTQQDNDAKAVGWLSKTTQDIRFSVLSQLANFQGETIIDIGCGIGDFYGYLVNQQIDPRYSGIDISPQMVKRARAKYPGIPFHNQNFLVDDLPEPPDYILASGTFSMAQKNPYTYLKKSIQQLFNQSKKGIAFNVLSTKAPKSLTTSKRFHHYCPEKVLNLCLKETSFVRLHHDYLPNDFTVYLYK